MQLIRLGAAALNQTPLDWAGNRDRILAAIDAARADGVGVLCLPELCVTGYGCEDAFHSTAVMLTAQHVLNEIIPHTREMIVALGVPLLHWGQVYNAACIAVDSEPAGFVCKQHLAGDGIHYEPRWFKRWSAGAVAEFEFMERVVPLGDLVVNCDGVRIGIEICEDAWVADRPGVRLADRGVDIILNPSASHFAFGKRQVRERFVLEGSRAFHVSYVLANLVGNEAGRALYDGHTLIASQGKVLESGPRFSYADHQIISAVVDVDATRMLRARTARDVDESVPPIGKEIAISFRPPFLEQSESRVKAPQAWETSLNVKEEEFMRSVALGLFDYLRKSRSGGFVVSLSGGADSSSVVLLVGLALRWACTELGVDGVRAKLGHIAALQNCSTEKEITHALLTCVYQGTRNSSETTRQAAQTVAELVGGKHYEWNVDSLVTEYESLVEKALKRELSWESDDLARQNIQARVRAPGVWLLANLDGSLLLATSNRSEAAVGYATMDGDTCGGLAPIAGIDKAFLRNWLRWMEKTGPAGVGPLPQLSVVNEQKPTAELRPQESKQSDEADLMPYEVLDTIERAAIRDKLSPVEVYRQVSPQMTQYDSAQLANWIDRFFRLWCRNQWKRERFAPSFHLDDENLDPKTWCRFPILSGGYERELAELHEFVQNNK